MGKFVISWTLLLTWSLTSAQFLYNYEPEQVQAPPASEEYDPSQYRYNPPSTVQQHFVQPVESPRVTQRAPPPPRRQQRVQPQPQVQYEPEPQIQYEPEPQPQYQPQQHYQPQPQQQQLDPQYQPPPENYEPVNQPQYQNTRRVSRKRQRTRVSAVGNYQPPQEVKPPIVYGPSIFENFALGQAPDGVHIPQDSLLNTLLGKKPQRQYSSPPQQSNQIQAYSQPQQEPPTLVQQYQQRYQAPQQTQPRHVSPPAQQQSQHYQQPEQTNSQPPIHYQQPVEQPQQYFVQPPAPQQQVQYRQQAQPVQEFRQPSRRRVQQQQRPPIAQPQPARRQQQPAPQYQHAPQPQIVHRAPEPAYNADYEEFEDDLVRERAPVHTHRQQREEVRTSSQSRPRPQFAVATAAPQVRQATTFKPANLAIAALPDDTDFDGIPGQAAVDYPTLHVIPTTSFSCAQQPHNGYYADMETSCQVVHLCQFGGEQDSFLCPNGTIFSQEKFSCQWWYKVNCADSPRYYGINDNLYKVPATSGRSKK